MRWFLLTFLCALAAAPVPRAYACGGFFCSTAPIIQSRETVVYGYEDDGTLTMAVQISYQGRDEDFAWILPVPVPPDEITAGTDVLFTQLRNATEPQIVVDRQQTGTCAQASCSYTSGGGGLSLGCASAGEASFADSGFPSAAFTDAGSVEVFSESVVGPYDTVVLGATTAAEVVEWLGTEGYDIPEATGALLEPYARQGFVFVALRLNAARESSVIRPIVMRMATGEACLPIRLTPIASTPNLPMNLFFLADGQARSSNYSFVDPGADPELYRGGSFAAGTRWDDAVAAATAELGGHAFATDYADATPSVAIELLDVSDLAMSTDPGQLIWGLRDRGYIGNPLVTELLPIYIEPPPTSDPATYFNCLANRSTVSCGAPSNFDPAGLIAAIEAEVTIPAREAQALVDRHPFTTRLSTTMRVEDMTIDPVFVLDPDLPDVPRTRDATVWTRCSSDFYASRAPRELELDGELYSLSEGSTATEDEICRAMGATADSGGCSAAANSQASTFALVTLLGLFMAAVYRRRRA